MFATLFARAFKAACAPTTSASGCFHEHDHGPPETPQPTGKWLGRLSPADESCLSTGTTAKASQGQGPRTPYLGTPHRDCSRWRLRPDLAGFGHLLSREPPFSLSGATRETGGTASAARACKRARRQGRAACRLREEGGRSPTRGAFHPPTARKRAGVSVDGQPKLDGNHTAPFSPPGDMSEGRSLGLRKLGLATMESDCSPACRLTAAPQRTSAFEWRSAARCAAELPLAKMPRSTPESQ